MMYMHLKLTFISSSLKKLSQRHRYKIRKITEDQIFLPFNEKIDLKMTYVMSNSALQLLKI